jgi:hypothetical protein
MKTSIRTALLCTGLLVGGAVAGPVILGSGHHAPTAYALRAGTPGAFVAISSYRTMDSRIETNGTVVGQKLGRTQDDTASGGLAQARFVQFELNGSNEIQFPDEAVAVTFNVTVTQTEGAGFVQIEGFGNATGSTSTVNWSGPGQTVANGGVALLTPAFDELGALGVYLGGATNAKAHVVLDITGYYLPVP